jgi:hypothetical protein
MFKFFLFSTVQGAGGVCTNNNGGYSCSCLTGFNDVNEDGTSCIDWNECSDENGGHSCEASRNRDKFFKLCSASWFDRVYKIYTLHFLIASIDTNPST